MKHNLEMLWYVDQWYVDQVKEILYIYFYTFIPSYDLAIKEVLMGIPKSGVTVALIHVAAQRFVLTPV